MMVDTPRAGRFFTCCWLVVLVLLATLLVGPSSTNHSGAHAGVTPPAQTRIAHWNFNNGQTGGTTYALPIAASSGSGSVTSNFATANVVTFTGSSTNLVSGDAAGNDLAVQSNANNGRYVDFTFNSVGFVDITLTLMLRRTSTGFNPLAVQTNGVTRASIAPAGTSGFELMTVDLSSYAEIEDNPAAVVRFLFDGATSTSGNNRMDNVQFLGTALSPSPSSSPTSTPSPSSATSPTSSPSSSSSSLPTSSPSSSSSNSPAASPSSSSSNSPTSSPSSSSSPSLSPTASPSSTTSPSSSNSPAASPSSSSSPTSSPSASSTSSRSPSPSSSPSSTPSGTPSPTRSPSNSPSPSATRTSTPSPTNSPPPSSSPSSSPSFSPSSSTTPSQSASPSTSPSTSPSANAGPSASSTPACQAEVRRLSRSELDDHKHVRSLLSTKLLGRPHHVTALGLRNRAAACQSDLVQLPLDSDFETRRASATDPATIRERLGVAAMACPVASSYNEFIFIGTAVDAVRHWTAPDFADADVLDRATHFGLGVWQIQEQATSKGRQVSTFLLSVVEVTDIPSQCPPIYLPDAYETPSSFVYTAAAASSTSPLHTMNLFFVVFLPFFLGYLLLQ